MNFPNVNDWEAQEMNFPNVNDWEGSRNNFPNVIVWKAVEIISLMLLYGRRLEFP
jgi:hypothetical protein